MAKLPGVATTDLIAFSRMDAADGDDVSGTPSAQKKAARGAKRLPCWARDAVVSLAHELRNPMQSALGFAQILLNPDYTANLTPKQRGYLQRIVDAVQQMESIIHFMAAPELTPEQLRYHILAPGTLIRAAVAQLAPQAREKGVRLQSDVPPRLPRAQLDRERVLQILMNLGGNAVKFTPAGSTVTLGARSGREQGTIEFFVRDEGPGIPKRYQHAIFHPFVQVPRKTNEEPQGRGLGLAIVEQLVTLMGGAVWVESERQHGATFWVRLPIQQPESAPKHGPNLRGAGQAAGDDRSGRH